jgi:tripartite ATP-independent transporter DctP family solute receptor
MTIRSTFLIAAMGSALAFHAAGAADYTIKFAHNSPPKMDASFHRYFTTFEELAKKYTDGRVEFQEFPASQMGSDQDAAKKLQLGTIEMMDIASNNLAQLYGGFDLFTLPFLIKGLDCGIDHVLVDDQLREDISGGAQEKANIRVLAFETGGVRNIMNSKRPITAPEDLKGLRMRVAKNPILLDTYAALGADAIGIASAETYGALQTKMVDGHDGGSGWAYAQKLFEVQNFYSLTGHQMVVTSVIINNDFFESLPADIQEGLQRAAREAAVQNMEWMRGYEKDIYGHFEDAGLKINTLDLAPFSEAVRPVWDKYAERVGGQERIDRVLELQAACEQS